LIQEALDEQQRNPIVGDSECNMSSDWGGMQEEPLPDARSDATFNDMPAWENAALSGTSPEVYTPCQIPAKLDSTALSSLGSILEHFPVSPRTSESTCSGDDIIAFARAYNPGLVTPPSPDDPYIDGLDAHYPGPFHFVQNL
jgi:hypothetical protein